MNPLIEILPARVRRWLYALYGLVALVFQAIDAAADPGWLETGMKALVPIGAALGLVAASNTPTPARTEDGLTAEPEPVQTDNSPRPEDPADQPPQDPAYLPPSDDVEETDGLSEVEGDLS